jgi:hypothetical protein
LCRGKLGLIERAIQRCSSIIEPLEKEYAVARKREYYLYSDTIRVQIETYEHAIQVLRKKYE